MITKLKHCYKVIQITSHLTLQRSLTYIRIARHLKTLRYLGDSWFNEKKINRLHLYLHFSTQTNYHGQWKIDCLQQCGARKVLGKMKSKPLLTTPKVSLYLKKVMQCIWWEWNSIRHYKFLAWNQMSNSDKYSPNWMN